MAARKVTDRGKLDRFLGCRPDRHAQGGLADERRHDNGIIALHGIVYVTSVLTWRTPSADELAGQVALFALQRFGR